MEACEPMVTILALATLAGCSCAPERPGPPGHDSAPPSTADSAPVDTGAPDTAPPAPEWIGVAAGFAASCGIRPDGTAECWGSEYYLGPNGTRAGPFVQLAIGDVYACGLREDGAVTCWGCESGWDGAVCQTRQGPYVQLVGGSFGACAQRLDGTWECWGEAATGEPFAPPPPLPFGELEMAHHLICGVETPGDPPVCWGKILYPEEVPPEGLEATKIAGGFQHVCVLDLTGYPTCWGLANDLSPYPPPPDEPFVDIDAREVITCGLRADGTASCWSPALSNPVDLAPPADARFAEISVGNTHACGLTVDGEIRCWGHDRAGETVVPE